MWFRIFKLNIMKSTEIHNGLVNKEIRDFLSKSLVNIFEEECNNKKVITQYGGDIIGFDRAIMDTENEIVFLNKKLELLKQKQSVIKLIKMNGWDEFDVSEYTYNNTAKRQWMNFVGTESEYNTLVTKLISEEDEK